MMSVCGKQWGMCGKCGGGCGNKKNNTPHPVGCEAKNPV